MYQYPEVMIRKVRTTIRPNSPFLIPNSFEAYNSNMYQYPEVMIRKVRTVIRPNSPFLIPNSFEAYNLEIFLLQYLLVMHGVADKRIANGQYVGRAIGGDAICLELLLIERIE